MAGARGWFRAAGWVVLAAALLALAGVLLGALRQPPPPGPDGVHGDWDDASVAALLLFGLAWLGAIVAVVLLVGALALAGLGRGALARWEVVAASGPLALVAVVAALSLASTAEPYLVAAVLVASLAGLGAAAKAWTRAR